MDNTDLLWMIDLESSLFKGLPDNALFRRLSITEFAAGDKPFALAEETLRFPQQKDLPIMLDERMSGPDRQLSKCLCRRLLFQHQASLSKISTRLL